MKLLILVHHRFNLWQVPAWFAERLRREFPQLEVVHVNDYAAAEPHLADAEIVITWSLRPEQFARARRLRWIHSTAAAVHALMIPEIINSDVVISNASGVHGPVVAEHAMAMIMAMARRLPSSVLHQRERRWAQEQIWEEQPRTRELAGATLGVIGVGSIGGAVARMALAFDMKILAVREHPERGADFLGDSSASSASSVVEVFGFSQLDRVLPLCDFLLLAAPFTPKTQALIDANHLGRMKRDAYFINVARGALVDEAALIAALRQRKIGGAALDVFEHEPLPDESPLWDMPNVLITPHSAGFTERMWERHYALFAENLRRYITGLPLLAVIDKHKGY